MSENNVADLMETSGGFEVPSIVNTFAEDWVGKHYLIALAVIVALTLTIIWLAVWKYSEKFNPTQNMRDQDGDQFGLGAREHLADRANSVFAQTVQTPGGGLNFAAAGAPGSIGQQILSSPDYDCANRKNIGDDAWAWMSGVAGEPMAGSKPKNDNDFSRVLAGR